MLGQFIFDLPCVCGLRWLVLLYRGLIFTCACNILLVTSLYKINVHLYLLELISASICCPFLSVRFLNLHCTFFCLCVHARVACMSANKEIPAKESVNRDIIRQFLLLIIIN